MKRLTASEIQKRWEHERQKTYWPHIQIFKTEDIIKVVEKKLGIKIQNNTANE